MKLENIAVRAWSIVTLGLLLLSIVGIYKTWPRSQPKPSAQRAFPMCADDEMVVNSTNDSLPHCVARADKDEFGGARSVWLHNEISLTDPCDPTIGGFVEVNGVLYICQNAIVWNSWPDVPPLPKVYIPKELQ